MNRRKLIRTALGSAAYLSLMGCRGKADHSARSKADDSIAEKLADAPAPPPPKQPNGAHAVVIIHLDGGIDPVLTTLPRIRDQVNAEVDVPYDPAAIAGTAALPLGPHFAELSPFADRLAIINGVNVDTANHTTGWGQIVRLRTRAFPTMPTILDIIAGHRPDAALPTLHFGAGRGVMYSSEHADGYLSFDLHADDPNRLRALAQTLSAQGQELRGLGQSAELSNTAASYEAVAKLADKLATTPKFEEVGWGQPTVEKYHLQKTLWALEHDLTSTAYIRVRPQLSWDSHNHNLLRQGLASSAWVPPFARFLGELSKTQGPHGLLSESTLVVVASEIGRFPRLNGNAGKDHFPELPVMFFGHGIAAGSAFGDVDERMAARPVDLTSGRAVASNQGHSVRLDDIGATVLHLAGIDPSPYGYNGADLRFLRRAG